MTGDILKRWAAIACLTVLCSCAHENVTAQLLAATTQNIRIDTPGVAQAQCFIKQNGLSQRAVTPTEVTVRLNATALDVLCFKGEHMIGTQTVATEGRSGLYPPTINIAMSLDQQSLARKVTLFNGIGPNEPIASGSAAAKIEPASGE